VIAGTPFVLAELAVELERLRDRVSRACVPLGFMRRLAERVANTTALCLACPEGMVVLTLDEGPGETIDALVLLAVSTGERGAFQRLEPHMLAIARDLGAHRLGFYTERAGWRRLIGPEWKRDGELYWRGV